MSIRYPCHNCLVISACRQLCSIFDDKGIINDVMNCRYGDNLLYVLKTINAKEILSVDYECDYQGFVDIDALLDDGRVFSYKYYYGSCSSYDEWESLGLSDLQIEDRMLQEATFFDDIDQYKKWVNLKNERKEH